MIWLSHCEILDCGSISLSGHTGRVESHEQLAHFFFPDNGLRLQSQDNINHI